jgi:hypothetical protein
MKHKFPSIRALTHALKCEQKSLRRCCSKEDLCDPYDRDSPAGTDLRLQVNGDAWFIHSGSSDYDQDHRGVWGATFLPWGRANLSEIARDLLNQAKEGER